MPTKELLGSICGVVTTPHWPLFRGKLCDSQRTHVAFLGSGKSANGLNKHSRSRCSSLLYARAGPGRHRAGH